MMDAFGGVMNRLSWVRFAMICGLIFAVFPIRDVQSSPTGPSVAGGEHPWLNWSGYLEDGGPHTTYTVPDGRVLVITTVIADTCRHFVIQKDADRVFNAPANASLCLNTNAFIQGRAHLVFEAGSVMGLYGSGGASYYVEGYLAHR
jgi:hypothetical protein